MWDATTLHTIGNFSVRKFATALVAVIVMVFLWTLAFAPTTYAADASWNGDAVRYQNNDYKKLDQLPSATNLPAGTTAYEYRETGPPEKANLIYFPSGTDATTASSAQYKTYTVSGGNYANPSSVSSLTVDPKAVNRSFGTTGGTSSTGEATSCAVKGIGWMVCPATRWLAEGMDTIFNLLKGFLTVQPISLDSTSSIYRVWEMMRNFANIVFVGGFLIIIYSQITSIGLSNYDIKKMIPRLIIAAILVNVSYYICALGVDISNILGTNLQQAFIDMRGNVVGANTQATNVVTWSGMSGAILGGTSLAVAGGIALNAGAAAAGPGLVFLLVPFLVGVLLAVIVALLVLAARQALITILIVISPLAFVAFLLPNTEKWFEKWRETFMTMLLLFPIFSILFGGSQLAGSLIIQNANDINTILIGMFVQVAPIVITPLLVKFSGGLLGRFAGIVNNPNKGIIDRTRKWSQGEYDKTKARRVNDGIQKGNKWYQPMRKWGTAAELRRRDGKHRESTYEATAEKASEAHWKERIMGGDEHQPKGIHRAMYRRETQRLRNAHGSQYSSEMIAQALGEKQEAEKKLAQTGNSTFYKNFQEGEHGIEESAVAITTTGMRKAAAEQMHQRAVANALVEKIDNTPTAASIALSNYAGAGEYDPKGALRAQAKAQSALVNAGIESVKDIQLASEIMPGRIMEMRDAFNKAVEKQNIEEVRAYANMLAESSNKGFIELRDAIKSQESNMSPDVLAVFKHHVNSHPGLNAGAEDIVSWSRDPGNRTLDAVGHDPGTWRNVSAASFIALKQSSQELAISVGGISKETAQQIIANPSLINVKPPVIERLRDLANS